jgi:NADH:ubiquinone oxidoreductase subunit 5 (subunit L)/multisubunit Na+/H+ antiporter MnhA subunit
MRLSLYAWIALPPLVAALWIGLKLALAPQYERNPRAEARDRAEQSIARIALGALWISFAAVLLVDGLALAQGAPGQVGLGTWLASGTFQIRLELRLDALALALATTVALVSLVVMRFSVRYMHRETGFGRFLLALSLFSGAMLTIVTAGNLVLAFAGWELAGLASYLLIGYAQERPYATESATRAFVVNRIGDAGFLLAIFLSFAWLGGTDWPRIDSRIGTLNTLDAGLILLGLLAAAFAKSAVLPFSAWVSRALEGPTPSSAVFYGSLMVHAGIYLLIRCEPLFDAAPSLMPFIALAGLATAVYGWLAGLTQADVKSGLMFSTTAQIGLMTLWCGLGWFELASAHLILHALWRAWHFLNAPALMHWMSAPARPISGWLSRRRFLYGAAVERFWLDPIGDWLVVRPVRQLAEDVRTFDGRVVERLVGLPSESTALASLGDPRAQREGDAGDPLASGSGLLGSLMAWAAGWLYWFEERLVLRGGGERLKSLLGEVARGLLRVEDLLGRPRYLLLLVLATLAIIL